MAREDPQLKIRLPEALKDSIESAAGLAGRSMNAEIIQRLQQSFEAQPAPQQSRDYWTHIAELERRRSVLQASLVSLQRAEVDLLDQLTNLDPSEAGAITKESLRQRQREVRLSRFSVEMDIATIGTELSQMYDAASTDAPGSSRGTTVMKIAKA